MKYIFLVLILAIEVFGGVLRLPIISVDEEAKQATVKINKIDIGMSGFVSHKIKGGHSIILNNAVVKGYNKETKIATLQLTEFIDLRNNALPDGNWKVEVGDTAVLAFGYTRALLIAPNEELYYRITKSSKIQWVHPDIFATILSFNGHPTPLREDFTKVSIETSIGLVYIFLDKKIFTLDSKSFKILTIIEADLHQDETHLPFYTRVPEIDANWFGDGSDELEYYEPHYYKLMAEANPKNQQLYDIVKARDTQSRADEASEKEEFEDLDGDRFEEALEVFSIEDKKD